MRALNRLALITLLAAPGNAAWAEGQQAREGFWIGFGFGYGSADADCDDCGGGEREGSIAGFLKLGGTFRRNVLLGAEWNVWTKEEAGETLTLGSATAALHYYPRATGGFFLKVGTGFSLAGIEFQNEHAVGFGWGFLAGLGYDFRVGRNISVTPSANFYFGQPGDLELRDGGTVLSGWKQNVFDISLGITFH